jgi:hypothetical protein
MTAQVHVNDVAASLFKANRDIFPDFTRLPKAVQQDDGGFIGGTDIIRFKSDPGKALKFSYISKRHSPAPQILSNGVIYLLPVDVNGPKRNILGAFGGNDGHRNA